MSEPKVGQFAVTKNKQKYWSKSQYWLFAVINYEQKRDNVILLEETKEWKLCFVHSY